LGLGSSRIGQLFLFIRGVDLTLINYISYIIIGSFEPALLSLKDDKVSILWMFLI
jgi:hypothetical protein